MSNDNVFQLKPRETTRLTDTTVPANMKSLAESFNQGRLKGLAIVTFEACGTEEQPDEEVRVRVAIDELNCVQLLALQGALTQVQSYIVEALTGGNE